MLRHKKLLLLAAMALLFSSVGAQTNSPYSRYGYGVLNDHATGVSKGMGGVSYGVRNSLGANANNPASYSAVDSLTFLFDISFNFNHSKLKDVTGSRSDYNGGLDYITILMPVAKGLGVSAGLLPYSTVGYKFGTSEKVGGVAYDKLYEGSGGLHQAYVGAGYKMPFVKGLSVGANASFIWGNLKNKRSIPYIGGGVTNNLSAVDTEFRLTTFKFDIGAQYEFDITKNNKMTVGAVYSPQVTSKARYTSYDKLIAPNGGYLAVDTASVKAQTGLPHTFGFGFTLNLKNRWLVGADITHQRWAKIKYPSQLLGDGMNSDNRFNNRWRYNVGGEFVIEPYSRNFFRKIRFRGGANYSDSYMNALNKNGVAKGYHEYGATVGFGLPLYDPESFGRRTSYLNINFEYKKLSPKGSGMITENYFGVSVSVNLNELWFYQKKIR